MEHISSRSNCVFKHNIHFEKNYENQITNHPGSGTGLLIYEPAQPSLKKAWNSWPRTGLSKYLEQIPAQCDPMNCICIIYNLYMYAYIYSLNLRALLTFWLAESKNQSSLYTGKLWHPRTLPGGRPSTPRSTRRLPGRPQELQLSNKANLGDRGNSMRKYEKSNIHIFPG